METAIFLLGLVACTFALPVEPTSASNCTINEFSCKNGKCISEVLKCDQNDDCGDGSDEEACELIPCEDPLHFRCKNTNCVNNSTLCDGEDDCGDSSDELNCPTELSDAPLACEKGMWECVDKKLCIPVEKVCNGESDCADLSDETKGCNSTTSNMECDGFVCTNGQCLPKEWVCDGQYDCGDRSDEQNCTIPVSKMMFPEALKENYLNGKGTEQRETLDKLLSICLQRGNMEQTQSDELHSIRMQVEEENLRAAKLRVQVAELQIQIEETKLETAKLDS